MAHKFIQEVETIESHYSKTKKSGRRYLRNGVTKKKLWRNHREKMREINIPCVKYETFRKIFRLYNIGKTPPKVDVCNFCTIIRNLIKKYESEMNLNEATRNITKMDVHLRRSERAYDLLKRFKPHGENYKANQACICIDLAAAQPIPKLPASCAFYCRKISAYNCGIHNLNTGKGHMFVWPENLAKRGSNEIASCLYKYIEDCVSKEIKDLVIFSDNCAGQNKNLNITLACLRLIQAERFRTITHIFMVAGHSYMDCDRDFGCLARSLKGKSIHSFQQLVNEIKISNKKNPFYVHEMKQEDFKNFDELQKLVTNRRPFEANFSEGRIFVYSSSFKEGYYMKNNYSTWMGLLGTEKVDLRKGDLRRKPPPPVPNLAEVTLKQLYTDPIKLSEKKVADIYKLMKVVDYDQQHYLDSVYREQTSNATIQPDNYNDYQGDNDVEFTG